MNRKIPFSQPYLTGREVDNVTDAILSRKHCGNHTYNQKCIKFLQEHFDYPDSFMVPSGTDALEMGILLSGIGAEDEVILPSYTFSSTANAIVLCGAKPVFCEVDPLTMNMDPSSVEALITAKTRMLLPIDYAGIPCELNPLIKIARNNDLIVFLDAAQSFDSFYRGKPVGADADMLAFSFHETKNITCGEGGALVVNRKDWIERAHFIQEKGTDRSLVLKGLKNKYSWVSKGSSFLQSELNAAMLYSQMENKDKIRELRGTAVSAYYELFSPYATNGIVSILNTPEYVIHNYHAFWVIFDSEANQQNFLSMLSEFQVNAYIGYLPLHSSPFGQSLGYKTEDLPVTEDLASRIVRLPLYADLQGEDLEHTITSMANVLKRIYG